ncbi:hypothetical protein NFI96_017734 [Prochilodus magdalenae]|nr:hypothetical protein NFI96_017734 [Prochilodus magdalenae]
MGRLTEMSLLCVLLMASSAFGAVVESASEADSSELVAEQLNEPQSKEESVQPRAVDCGPGFTNINDRCFVYIERYTDWATAENHCMSSFRGHLASIHSDSEYEMVRSLLRSHDSCEGPIWLGLSNCEMRNTWFWSDGSPFDYSKWNMNKPNGMHEMDCCTSINIGHHGLKDWNSVPCHMGFPYFCVRTVP